MTLERQYRENLERYRRDYAAEDPPPGDFPGRGAL